jgi:hypothetical protein
VESESSSACDVLEAVPAAATRDDGREFVVDSVRGVKLWGLKAPPCRPPGESARDSRVRVDAEAWASADLDSDGVPAEAALDPVSSESACAVFAVANAVPMPSATAKAPILPIFELAFLNFGDCPEPRVESEIDIPHPNRGGLSLRRITRRDSPSRP